MKKTVVWACVEASNGYGEISWFLKEEHAERHNDQLGEPLSDNIHSAETFEGSDIHQSAVENSKKYAGKHEYLERENYYEDRSVGTGAKSAKTCEHCGKNIPKGEPHSVHHFYPEFASYPTHKKCNNAFMKSLN